ncbi:uncharacterized protein CC84DRAFT_1256551 [Paraphaeosphaeria sporulosa]|uniref:Uncharacterized protein n=1 Tax=Paraphaeosphaeria sporulosa TaxID=1460663 RepID=A0A177CVA6_9PLEO|nr:uncharacterized protein CC84DRAFT_1256551 [Paraphaeosphaeria sporulosa]OAG10800.1 hypothetical protein CC84DRAFT_1256551 [Paraphaeosphaeria sporulosa]
MDSPRSPTFGGFHEHLAVVLYEGDRDVQALDRIAEHTIHPLNQVFIVVNLMTAFTILGRDFFVSTVVALLTVAVIVAFAYIFWTFMAEATEATPIPTESNPEAPNNDVPTSALTSVQPTPEVSVVEASTTKATIGTVAKKTVLLMEAPPTAIKSTLEAPSTDVATADVKAPIADSSTTKVPTTDPPTTEAPRKDPRRCLAPHLRNKQNATSTAQPRRVTVQPRGTAQSRGVAQPCTNDKARSSNKPRAWSKPTPSAPRRERQILSGWGDIQNAIRADDIAITAANEAKADSMKDVPWGEWTTNYLSHAPRVSRTG